MKQFILTGLLALALVGCGTKTQEIVVEGTPGQDGISMGIELKDGQEYCGSVGGIKVLTFVDSNRDGFLTLGEETRSMKYVCNGQKGDTGNAGSNGQNGQNGTQLTITQVSQISECSNRSGIQVSDGTTSYYVCSGEQGIQGVKGDTGNTGSNGNNGTDANPVSFVKLCSNNDEYAIRQGTDLYAVGFNYTVGGGLIKMAAGSTYYTTTNPTAACKFTVNADGTVTQQSGTTNITSNFLIYQHYQQLQTLITQLQAKIVILESEVDGLQQQVEDLEDAIDNQHTTQLQYVSHSQVNGIHNNAEVNAVFKNNSSVTLTKFKVTIQGLGSSQIRSGSSLTGPYGNVISSTSNTITYLITTSGGLEPGQNVNFRVLIDSLTSSQVLTLSAEAL